jgi:Fe(3+) dicitrate transport protein
MILKVFSTVFLCLLLINSAQAQFAIKGTVKNGADGSSIKASVKLQGSDSLHATNEQGMFVLNNLHPGKYILTIIHPDFSEHDELVQVKNRDIEVEINLQNRIKELRGITVSDQRASFGFTRLRNVDGFSIFAGKKTEAILPEKLTANLSTNNARQVYSKVAGLNIYENDGAGLQLSIGGRGLDPNRTANFNVRQNGYDIAADALGYPESYYTPPVEALRRIQIVRGAASLQYGTQFGGLLNFEMKQPRSEKGVEVQSRNTVGSYGYFASFNSINANWGKWNTYSFVQYKRGDGFRPNSKFEAKTAYFDLHYNYKEKSHIGFELTHMDYLAQQPGGLTDAMFKENPRQSNRSRNWFSVDWNLLDLEWEHQFTSRTKFNARVFSLIAERQSLGFRPPNPSVPDDGTEREMIGGDFRNIGAEFRFMHQHNLFKKANVLLVGARAYRGFNHNRQGLGDGSGVGPDFGFPEKSDVQSDYRYPNNNASLFAENIFYINKKWSVTPGVRIEYMRTVADGYFIEPQDIDLNGNPTSYKTTVEYRVNPRSFPLFGVGVSYKAKDYLEFYGNISQNYRSVTFNDMRNSVSIDVDPNIKDEKGYSLDFGARGNQQDVFNYDISLFAMLYGNRIGEIFKPGTSLDKSRTNIGRALIGGVESYLELQLLKAIGYNTKLFDWSLFTNTAFIHSRYIESKIGNVKGKEVEFIPSMNVKMGTQARFRNFKTSVQYSYLSNQFTDAENSYEPHLNTATVGILPAYGVLDWSLSYEFKWLKLEGSINNLTNKMYATRRASGYPGPGLLPADGRGFYLTAGVKL